MKKFFISILILFVALIFSALGLLFTETGNSFLAHIAQDKIKEKSGLDLNISTFKMNFSSIELQFSLANIAQVQINGDLSPLSLSFDLNYDINLDKTYAKQLNLPQNIDFKGKIKGKASDFNIDGEGLIFGSKANLNARILNYSPIELNLSANAIKIEEILKTIGLKNYAFGRLDLIAKITAKELKPYGNAIIKLNTTNINYSQIQKDFNISLPEKSELKGEILATINENLLDASVLFKNDYLILQSQKTNYDLNSKELKSSLELKIPNLLKLEKLIKSKMSGALELNAEFSAKNNILNNANAVLKGLGGDIKAELKNNELNIFAENAKLEKISSLTGYPGLAKGDLKIEFKGVGLDFKNFNATILSKNAKLENSALKKYFNLNLPNTEFKFNAKTLANNGKIDYEANLTSKILNIKKLSGNYDLNNKFLKINSSVNIDDLGVFSDLAGLKMKGEMKGDLKAEFIDTRIQKIEANVDLADGKILANSNGKTLDIELSKLDLEKLLALSGQEIYASGKLNSKAKIDDINAQKFDAKADLKLSGILNEKVLSKILEKNFPQNSTFELSSNINLKQNVADFSANLSSNLAKITNFKGKFELDKMLLKSNYTLEIADFSKLGFLLERKLSGRANFEGEINFDKNLNATARSENLFEGKLDANLKNDILDAKIQKVDLPSLTKGFDFSDLYEGKADVKIDYNIKNEKGTANLDMKEGKLKKTTLTNALNLIIGKDITDDVFHTAKANANINKNLINFQVNMQAKRSKIDIKNASLNTQNKALNMSFDIKIDRAEFKGTMSGTSENPKIKLDGQSVINTLKNNEKINKEINKLFKKLF